MRCECERVTECDGTRLSRDRREAGRVSDRNDGGVDYITCHMASSFDLQEELEALKDLVNYSIEHEHDIHSMEPGEMDALLRRLPSLSYSIKGDLLILF
jgi:hypothetical protein